MMICYLLQAYYILYHTILYHISQARALSPLEQLHLHGQHGYGAPSCYRIHINTCMFVTYVYTYIYISLSLYIYIYIYIIYIYTHIYTHFVFTYVSTSGDVRLVALITDC